MDWWLAVAMVGWVLVPALLLWLVATGMRRRRPPRR